MIPPLPITLQASRTKNLGLLLLCLAFVLGGVWMIQDGEKLGWLVMGFFGLGPPVFLVQMLPGASYLQLDEDGFTFCNLYRRTRIRWRDVESFGVVNLGAGGFRSRRMVGFDYVSGHPDHGRGRALSKSLAGVEGALPDNYGWDVEELAALMNELRRRAYGD